MIGYIYKTTNKLNNWIYIGQHRSSKFSKSYKGSGKVLIDAFELYGKENFHGPTIGERATHQIETARAAGLDPVPVGHKTYTGR